MRSVFLVFFGATLVACVPSPEDTAPATPTTPAEATADLAVETEGFCANVAGGPAAAEDDAAVALSLAHANVRYFGLEPTHAVVDAALVEAIANAGDRVGPAAAQGFARALPSVCFVAAASTPLGEAKVTVRDGIAFVRPGTGSVEIPADAHAAVLDLRDVPDAAGLEDALARATSLLLDTPLRPLTRRVHVRTGFTDEAFAEQALYTEEIASAPLEAPPPRARSPLPLAVAIGSRVAPAGARIAAHLRATRRAWLVGEPLAVEVAETRWAPITATRGVAWRAFDLSDGDGRLPDVIAPDAVDDRTFVTAGAPPPVAREAHRAKAVLRRDFGVVQKTPLSVASARAALVSAHGATKLFFPYFGVRGDGTDARLRETLDAAKDVASRDDVRKLLRRFGNAIGDGHNWVVDGQTPARDVLPIMLDRVDGGIVVTRSYDAAFRPGDVVVSLDGITAERWFAREIERTYGATEGFRFFTAMQELTSASIPKSIVVRAPDGTTRTVTPSPRPFAGLTRDVDLFAGSLRRRGFLGDLGAPDVYYMNLDGTYVADDADVLAGLAEAAAARALVLDMRGHPANGGARWNPYDLLQRLVPTSFSSPKYRVPVLSSDGARADIHPYEDTYPPLDAPSFRGRIVYIVDHQAVSFAEDFSLMLVGARRATVVGRPTAGTTGSVSGMQLPGAFQFYFTGMEARWPDGRVHFGQGIVPDVLVTPKVEDYAAGRDPFLAAAIAVAKK